MTTYLVDTNVLSELFKRKRDARVVAWISSLETVSLSVITVEEIYAGLYYLDSAKHLNWFKNMLETRANIFSVNSAIADRSGKMRANFKKKGIQRSQADLLIAATAYAHNLTLVTRNEKDFLDCQIPVFNPFPTAFD